MRGCCLGGGTRKRRIRRVAVAEAAVQEDTEKSLTFVNYYGSGVRKLSKQNLTFIGMTQVARQLWAVTHTVTVSAIESTMNQSRQPIDTIDSRKKE